MKNTIKTLTILCILIFATVALGTYSYVEISSLKSQVDSLQGQVDMLQEEISAIHNSTDPTNNTRNFVFEWPSWDQKVVNGTLRMNLTFTLKEGDLSIIAKINDNEYYGRDGLGIIFDMNEDSEIGGSNDEGCMYYADNTIVGLVLVNDGLLSLVGHPELSHFHVCDFESVVGYTFKVTLPISKMEFYTSSDLVYVLFSDVKGGVHVIFRTGIPLEAI